MFIDDITQKKKVRGSLAANSEWLANRRSHHFSNCLIIQRNARKNKDSQITKYVHGVRNNSSSKSFRLLYSSLQFKHSKQL